MLHFNLSARIQSTLTSLNVVWCIHVHVLLIGRVASYGPYSKKCVIYTCSRVITNHNLSVLVRGTQRYELHLLQCMDALPCRTCMVERVFQVGIDNEEFSSSNIGMLPMSTRIFSFKCVIHWRQCAFAYWTAITARRILTCATQRSQCN